MTYVYTKMSCTSYVNPYVYTINACNSYVALVYVCMHERLLCITSVHAKVKEWDDEQICSE